MKIKYLFIFLLIVQLYSCYEDKGNYNYREINELEIKGLDNHYDRDIDDNLTITPQLEGTLYSDPSRFTFQWKIDGKVVSEDVNLDIIINLLPGLRKGRYMIKDKETGVIKYSDFTINVSSSTAGDLYMILSKSKGKAEMSYMRLDKEDANFAINYFEERFKRPLGTNPQQFGIIYGQFSSGFTSLLYPFAQIYGGVMVLVDNEINIIDKNSLEPDDVVRILTGESYTGVVAYPKPNIDGYKSQYLLTHTEMWRTIANGNVQTGFQFAEISDGKLYFYAIAGNTTGSKRTYAALKSPYQDGYLAPCCFFTQRTKDTYDYPVNYTYGLGEIMSYDMVNFRFTSSYWGNMYSIATENLPAYTGWQLFHGSPTNEAAKSYAILRNGSNFKIVILQRTSSSVFKSIGEADLSAIINQSSRFYTMSYSPYIYIATDDKIYVYNLLEAESGSGAATQAFSLSNCGYDASARITAICVARSEQRMLLGVSRYGSDTEAMSEESKGDLVQLDMNPSTFALTYDKKYEGVSGIPVDVKIKYLTHIRDGRDMTGTLVDRF